MDVDYIDRSLPPKKIYDRLVTEENAKIPIDFLEENQLTEIDMYCDLIESKAQIKAFDLSILLKVVYSRAWQFGWVAAKEVCAWQDYHRALSNDEVKRQLLRQ